MADFPSLESLEAPYHEERHAKHELATLQALSDSISHPGAKAAIQADLPAAKARVDAAVAARQAHEATGVTQAHIDYAAQLKINALAVPAQEAPTDAQPQQQQ